MGENCQEYLRKERMVFVEGHLQTNHYETEGGEIRFFTKVVAQQMQMLDRKPVEPDIVEEE